MPPQTPAPQAPQQPANAPYDFILRDPQAPQRRFSLGGGSNLIKIAAGAVALLAVVLIAVVVLGGGASNSDQLIEVAGRAQEISRVSDLAAQQSNDANTKYLASTTSVAMSSTESQLTAYLKSRKVKIDTKKLALYENKNTDAQLTSAQQNNQLEQAYDSYLKDSLNQYETSLKAAAKGASAKSLPILQDSSGSVQVLLGAPEISSLSTSG